MRIAEIFCSLQGEGRNQGRPTVFIRLAGCNLRCAWCDSPAARDGDRGVEMGVDAVLDRIWRMKVRHICITGGEPLLQIDEVAEACRRLQRMGYSVEIETNGTVDFRPVQPFASVCMDVKCPSSSQRSDISLLQHIGERDSVKFVVADEEDLEFAERVITHCPIRGETFISPVYGADEQGIARWVLAANLPARFQIQLHKYLEMR
ncbi:7-carboxy-7-deazaguanine synthase QueE [Methanofollis fontis]|uniref:7-carboxy-7-deazaguanine synthase n=1 Tax=Methanofollis fontis TaxID=2052832 RepID=A0A483CZT6_9EURY|nr:radical SAM protein [Methanofollis fontis]TAJ45699.1 7-carboxy-7-deazaguanine synthase [Methanofollis fontis]